MLWIDDEVHKTLEKWASDDFRRLNAQIEWLISQNLNRLERLDPAEKPGLDQEKSSRRKRDSPA